MTEVGCQWFQNVNIVFTLGTLWPTRTLDLWEQKIKEGLIFIFIYWKLLIILMNIAKWMLYYWSFWRHCVFNLILHAAIFQNLKTITITRFKNLFECQNFEKIYHFLYFRVKQFFRKYMMQKLFIRSWGYHPV